MVAHFLNFHNKSTYFIQGFLSEYKIMIKLILINTHLNSNKLHYILIKLINHLHGKY
jgi:hypothetical protein